MAQRGTPSGSKATARGPALGRGRKWLMTLLFLGCFGFAGGAAFLLFALVPLEHALEARGWGQAGIDRLLGLLVFAWGLIALAVTALYYRLALGRTYRPRQAHLVLLLVVVAAGAAFVMFLDTGVGIIAERRARVQQLSRNLTFGPYPDLDDLKSLKFQHYDGVITLLHPALPFEKVLLDRETANAGEAGIPVYSFPMLPWISENRDALEAIRRLLGDGSKRYYVHCYLGQHRANLVRQMATHGLALAGESVDELLPERLERGTIFTYEHKRIVLGPLPVEQEWFTAVLRHGVREVISTLDPADPDNQPWIEQINKVAADYNLRVTTKPIDTHAPDPLAIRDLAQYARNSGERVYILGYRIGRWVWPLDAALGGGQFVPVPIGRDSFERGPLFKFNRKYVLGPYPTDDEIGTLKLAGIREVVSLMDGTKPDNQRWIQREQQWTAVYGFQFTHISIPSSGDASDQISQATDYVRSRPGPLYIHGFRTDERVQAVANRLR
ncbi:MAG TPA: hypothetical protein VNK82_11485 [Terriglobales bacterium]|nr:hypothetical protein [Terriglobales bacterium]